VTGPQHDQGRGRAYPPRVRPAVPADIPELTRLRSLMFADLAVTWGTAPADESWRDAFARALTDHLRDAAMRIVVTDAPAGLAACGMNVLDQRLPSPWNPGGLIGHVFGIVTDPAYRRQGHARAIVADLLEWSDRRGITRVDLNASPDGQALYRSLGFGDHPDPTLSRQHAGP
jgi:ribosomal protein S18 acetylase RimI-like enzyme